jgi:hypothetical protein
MDKQLDAASLEALAHPLRSELFRAPNEAPATSTSSSRPGGRSPSGGARLLAVCPAGADDRAAFDAVLLAEDVLAAFD